MWKKIPAEVSYPVPAKTTHSPARSEAGVHRARIGAGLSFKGELSGDADVIIEGSVEGKITLANHGVIVEESGRVDADITANSVSVAGRVRGHLHGKDQVVLLGTSNVEGDITAKTVTIETGAQFHGNIDMERVVEHSHPAKTPERANGESKPNRAPQRSAAR